jgi:hypothetical protein
MNQADQLYLDKCEEAFLVFAGRNPVYEQTENNARRIAAELRLLRLSPTNAEHLQIVWDKLKPAPTPEPADNSVEAAARTLLLDATFPARVSEMSAEEFERACHDTAFALAVELSAPATTTRPPTRGEAVREAGITELVQRGEIKITPSAVPESSAPSRGVVNLNRAVNMPKSSTPKEFAAAVKHEKENQKFLAELAIKIETARRVKASRAKR